MRRTHTLVSFPFLGCAVRLSDCGFQQPWQLFVRTVSRARHLPVASSSRRPNTFGHVGKSSKGPASDPALDAKWKMEDVASSCCPWRYGTQHAGTVAYSKCLLLLIAGRLNGNAKARPHDGLPFVVAFATSAMLLSRVKTASLDTPGQVSWWTQWTFVIANHVAIGDTQATNTNSDSIATHHLIMLACFCLLLFSFTHPQDDQGSFTNFMLCFVSVPRSSHYPANRTATRTAGPAGAPCLRTSDYQNVNGALPRSDLR